MRDPATQRIVLLSLALLAFRVVSAAFIAQPGYTDAFYSAVVASRLAHGAGLSADFIWSFVEAPQLEALPVASHRFWMPLATLVQAAGIVVGNALGIGGAQGEVRAAQAPILLLAALVPFATWRAAQRLGASEGAALAAAAIVGLGGLFAPWWITLDGFAIAALSGTGFFLALERASAGSIRAGLLAGLAVGLLYLTRAEGALFGIALLALMRAPRSRAPGVAGSIVALVVGIAWLLRGLSLGPPGDLLARTVLLTKYEDLFALAPPDSGAPAGMLGAFLAAKAGALLTNGLTLVVVFLVLGVPAMILGVRATSGRHSPSVRAFAALIVLVYLVQSLLFTLHAVRGSYIHSLAAFFPFGIALAVASAERLLQSRGPKIARFSAALALAATTALSVLALGQWMSSYDPPLAARRAAAPLLPEGPLLAVDAAAWRWLSGRPAIVTPADGLGAAACAVRAYGARSIVIEPARFPAYESLANGGARPSWLGAPLEREGVQVFPVIATPPCAP